MRELNSLKVKHINLESTFEFDDDVVLYAKIYDRNKYLINNFIIRDDKYQLGYLHIKTSEGRFPAGFVVIKNDQVYYAIYIYEPHWWGVNQEREMITFFGHEQIVNLFLDNDEHFSIRTK